jgi:PRTRC genetic system protein A
VVALVDHLVARDGVPPRSGLAYDYMLAGDGLYLVTGNRYLDVRVPVAPATVRGLPLIYPSFTLRTGRLPEVLWEQILRTAYAFGAEGDEVLLAVTHDERSGYRLVHPAQIAGALRVVYRPVGDVVLEIHSHHRYAARFSPTDDADEQGLALYGVVGRLDHERPEVALRVGAYGHFLPVPWESVFDGDRGTFRDAYFDPPGELEETDVPD